MDEVAASQFREPTRFPPHRCVRSFAEGGFAQWSRSAGVVTGAAGAAVTNVGLTRGTQ